MKSYLQGLITGGVFVFALMVLMGATDSEEEIGRYQMVGYDGKLFMVNTGTGTIYRWTKWKMWEEKEGRRKECMAWQEMGMGPSIWHEKINK